MRRILPLAGMLAGLAAAQPGALEKAGNPGGLPTEWPEGPAAAVQPSWATPGKIRFARWDGGRLETAKAMLSGWPGFNPPLPDRIDAMTNWYAPRTVELLSQARVNTIWVTFSVGFSLPAERGQQEELKRYIAACHRAGIRVFAYQSIANLFWEDMFEQVPESKDWVRLDREGKPTPYGAASYSENGTRHAVHGPHRASGLAGLPEAARGSGAGCRRRRESQSPFPALVRRSKSTRPILAPPRT